MFICYTRVACQCNFLLILVRLYMYSGGTSVDLPGLLDCWTVRCTLYAPVVSGDGTAPGCHDGDHDLAVKTHAHSLPSHARSLSYPPPYPGRVLGPFLAPASEAAHMQYALSSPA